MPDQVTYINTRGVFRRLAMLLPLALALTGVWFSARWYLGDTIAENLDPDNHGAETARTAIRLAPDDPLAHWRLAEIQLRTLPLDQINQAIAEYELATRLSPGDYRFWLSFGRALEQSGNAEKGELAMRRAVELAPSYSFPRWYLGNLLLRNGHEAAAFAELRQASAADPELQPQVFSLAWQVYGENPNELISAIGPVIAVRAAFAKYLIDFGQVDQGLKIWSGLNPKEKKENHETGQGILKSLLEGKHFHRALELWNELAPKGTEPVMVERLIDGGCDQSATANLGPFGWQLKGSRLAQLSFDAGNKHGGARSLRLHFQSPGKVDFNVSQLVTIEPNTEYNLDCFIKTHQMASAGSPQVVIIDGADGSLLGGSHPAPPDNNDWQPIEISFKTGPKTEAIVIRIDRSSCGDNAVCPIFGDVWYDDFNLKRTKVKANLERGGVPTSRG
jgi:hypothetical protein